MMSFPPTRFVTPLLALFLVSISSSVLLAHNGEIPGGPPPPPPANVHVDRILPPRWTWIHWWEANRQRFLEAPQQAPPGQAPTTSEFIKLRDQVGAELVEAAKKGTRENLVIESALAAGKLQYEPALPVLKTLVEKSPSRKVQTAALVAIGLIGTPAAERELISFNPPKKEDRIAALAAIGLLPNLQADTLQKLRQAVMVDDPAVATVTAWAIRQHHQPDNLLYYGDVLVAHKSPWVASEALLALGDTREPRTIRVLADVLLGFAAADKEVLAWAELMKLKQMKDNTLKGRSYPQQVVNSATAARNADPNTRLRDIYIETGVEDIKLAWLRASAAIALGKLGHDDAAIPLMQFLDPPAAEDDYLLMPREFALMALAEYPSDRLRDRAIVILGRKQDDGRLHLETPTDSPIRGFAALALGLFSRPYETDQGPADRPGFDSAIMALADRLDDSREELEVRSACAVALGLTQRTAVLPVLNRVTQKSQTRNLNDVALFGFLMLGRALAGDQNIIAPAEQFLLARNDDTSVSGTLSRRAVVLALGLLRNPATIPILSKAWHLNYFVNKEVIVALRLAGANHAAKLVLEPFRKSQDEEERAYMAGALGELLAPDQPTRLARLTVESNYTVRNDNLIPLLRLSNEFLYDYLIASFGDQW